MPYDRVERLTDLILVLLHAQRPLTLDEIAHEVPGYPAGLSARRQAFERDKRLLREEGVPVLTEAVEGPEQFGYRIDPGRYYLPDLHLDREEQRALHLAVAGVHLGDLSGRGALEKLGALGPPEAGPLAVLAAPPHLHSVWEALRTRSRLGFSYRGQARSASPAGLWFRRGHWYLVGWDHGPEASRTFRVDRIEGVDSIGEPGSAEVPDGFDPARGVPGEPWRVGEGDEQHAVVEVDALLADRVVEEVGEDAVVARHPDGGARIELVATNFVALRSWLLGLLDHAELVTPPAWRAEVVAWLRSTTASAPAVGAPKAQGAPRLEGASSEAGVTPLGRPAAIQPAGTSRRLFRLLAMLGWLAQVGEASIAEVSERFGIGTEEVVRELELAACCGLPPYTPDTLMEIVVTSDRVRASLPEDLGRPRRLTPAEGLAVVAAARTLEAIPGAQDHGALGRALVKLEDALGRQRLSVDLDEPPLLDGVRRAAAQGTPLVITYYSASSDRTTERTVQPVRLSAIEGRWYLDALDPDAEAGGALRRFRVDRIAALAASGPEAPARPAVATYEADPGPAFVPGPDTTRVRLHLEPGGRWVLDSVPVLDALELADGAFEVSLHVGGTAWLERLLLQLGPEGHVLAPPELVSAGAEAARRVMARYEVAVEGQSVGAPA